LSTATFDGEADDLSFHGSPLGYLHQATALAVDVRRGDRARTRIIITDNHGDLAALALHFLEIKHIQGVNLSPRGFPGARMPDA
jgi:hypothetical protein